MGVWICYWGRWSDRAGMTIPTMEKSATLKDRDCAALLVDITTGPDVNSRKSCDTRHWTRIGESVLAPQAVHLLVDIQFLVEVASYERVFQTGVPPEHMPRCMPAMYVLTHANVQAADSPL